MVKLSGFFFSSFAPQPPLVPPLIFYFQSSNASEGPLLESAKQRKSQKRLI